MTTCTGSFRALFLYDLSEEIDLATLRRQLAIAPTAREPGFKIAAPVYVRFERPPVVQRLPPVRLPTGEEFEARLKYFDYGVVSLELDLPFQAGWNELIALSNRWIDAADLEQHALQTVQPLVSAAAAALVKPYTQWLDEIYYIVQLCEVRDAAGKPVTAPELLQQHGPALAQIVRGEVNPLSDNEQKEVLASSMSYYPMDLAVVGWMAAIVYDSAQGAAPTIQLIEYANTQLLEFRHYDEMLTRVLKQAYQALERGGGLFSRWRLAKEARRLNTLRLDLAELTERTDNAIKFLSDMFYARVYRLAAAKVGVNDYRPLVDGKLRTAGELYEFMVNEFREARAFTMELLVVIILVIELLKIFLGK
ncbi:MAG: hypothetical protein HYX25_00460 [Candidatus Solibacter usitatus]|nr:hypothetical protein [Candidatus Solibacter usitatus]